MLVKLLSKFKASHPAAQNPAETKAAQSIGTAEKTAALLIQLEADRAAAKSGTERHKVICKQQKEAELARGQHQIESERQRVAATIERDKASGQKALEKAQESLASADAALLKSQARNRAVLARLEPLEAQLTQAKQDAADQLNAAQKAFDTAVISGDESAEVAAAEKLYQLKTESNNPAGPLQLRLGAIRNEEIEVKNALAAAEQEKHDANKAILRAKADLALVEYDRQVQALLDAYVTQRIAVNACGEKIYSMPDLFGAQVGSAERIMFGKKIDGYSQKVLPKYAVEKIISDMSAEPDLAILAINAEDVAEPLPEPVLLDKSSNITSMAKVV